MLDCIIKETAKKTDAAIIWMHGLGANGHDFADIVPELKLPKDAAIRFLFPHAPVMPVSVNNGYKMPAWFDIIHEDLEQEPDIEGIEKSSKLVAELIDAEIENGINSERILLVGFSQGGVLALHTAMRYNKKLAGAASLSAFYPTAHTMLMNAVNSKIPVFFGHGSHDNVLPVTLGQKAFDFLKLNGNPVEMHTYHMQHSVCLEELKALGAWVYRQLAA
ncbi:MAG: alpha/beta hydrolase [Fibromonadales bacterium]|nr:alpha/beta hydrolase [Fibromonadales bacterium]